MNRLAILALPALALAGCQDQAAREQIKVVGSSTVYPFTTAVAEQFVNSRGMKAPVIESTGTGAGIKLFCAGVGSQHPDVANASRRMKKSEYDTCKANGAGELLEIQIGSDGVALAESTSGPKLSLTRKDIYLALAAEPLGRRNTAETWKDVNPALPAVRIRVLGPPATSGTRDAFAELILEPGCQAADPAAKALKDEDEDAYKRRCTMIRSDAAYAAYVDSGENDNLIVQKLSTDPNALGVFGYSYLEENQDRLTGVPVEGVAPTYETIAMGGYPGARPLYIYVKKRHLKAVRGLKEFLDDYSGAWDPDGPLTKRGLIAAPKSVREHSAEIVDQGIALDPAELH